nr:MAG TPA: Regulatory peptide helical complex, MEMBRANE PROTEIN [Caudoviricetes sp.]DAJ70092.1 MAG TPA: Regulatory peptide helical complex, MEMBRANE PROTEIN [Caudoviricetes sp.]
MNNKEEIIVTLIFVVGILLIKCLQYVFSLI